jgi:hypothetical protein
VSSPNSPEDELGNQALDLGAELLELVGDQLLDDGLLRDIPILSTAIQVARLGRTITDRIFLTKVKRFLFALNDVTEDDKQKFYERLQADEKLREKTGEVVTLVLDRLDDLGKPEILAKVFAAYVKGQISLDQFRRLASSIDLAFVDDLLTLASSSERSDKLLVGLVRTNLTEMSRSGMIFGDFVQSGVEVTSLGKLFIDIMSGKLQGTN